MSHFCRQSAYSRTHGPTINRINEFFCLGGEEENERLSALVSWSPYGKTGTGLLLTKEYPYVGQGAITFKLGGLSAAMNLFVRSVSPVADDTPQEN